VSASDPRKGYLVECYWPGVDQTQVALAARRAEAAASELRGAGRRVEFLGAILVPSDETVFCFFEGRKADVRAVSKRAQVPFERVLDSLRIDGKRTTKEG
jgi:hypothetical protein